MSQFSYKLTTESEIFTFDFNPVLVTGETISTATCTAIVKQGVDINPSAILSGIPVISLGQASQRVIGGLDEVVYRLVMTVTTSNSNTYTCVGDIPVYDPSSI